MILATIFCIIGALSLAVLVGNEMFGYLNGGMNERGKRLRNLLVWPVGISAFGLYAIHYMSVGSFAYVLGIPFALSMFIALIMFVCYVFMYLQGDPEARRCLHTFYGCCTIAFFMFMSLTMVANVTRDIPDSPSKTLMVSDLLK